MRATAAGILLAHSQIGGKKHLDDVTVALWFCAFAQYQPGDEPGDRGRISKRLVPYDWEVVAGGHEM